MTKNWILAGISTLALASVLAAAVPAQGRRPVLRALNLTRDQKEQALEIARAAQPYHRGVMREIRPQVHALLETLTPEQRARLAGRNPLRLERRLAFLLSRPGAAARIQRNLDR